ncbi:RNase H family protein [Micromonospora sp. NPDC052213]|uniref:ribonuclease HI n=1 Tax=Micromonospora sp. NPDC052213 TaxID=3155812 RepID=UPI003428E8A9
MRPDEFLRALDLLPDPLHDRAVALRSYARVTRCEDCQRIGDAVRLALTAAHYDELGSARQLLDTAEQQAARHEVHRPQPSFERGRGRVGRWAGTSAAVVAATDASWKGRAGGIGYVVSDGHYGLRGRGTGRLDPTGASRVLINELRAVDFLLSAYDEAPAGMTVLLDSLAAMRYLHRWQGGETDAMPAGYSLRPRRWADQPTLVRLAELVGRRPDLSFAHVKGHSGHALNEAADGLSHMARRRLGESFDVRPRAHALVDAFLRDWHTSVAR